VLEAAATSSCTGGCSMDSNAAAGLVFLLALPVAFQTAT